MPQSKYHPCLHCPPLFLHWCDSYSFSKVLLCCLNVSPSMKFSPDTLNHGYHILLCIMSTFAQIFEGKIRMRIIHGYNNGYNSPVYNAHKNVGVYYTRQSMEVTAISALPRLMQLLKACLILLCVAVLLTWYLLHTPWAQDCHPQHRYTISGTCSVHVYWVSLTIMAAVTKYHRLGSL